MVDLLVRTEELSHEEFVEYWLGPHAELARELPGLQKYVTDVPRDPSRTEFDGVVELYFEDTAALGAAFDSPEGEAVLADADEFIDREAGPTLVLEETVQFDATE